MHAYMALVPMHIHDDDSDDDDDKDIDLKMHWLLRKLEQLTDDDDEREKKVR